MPGHRPARPSEEKHLKIVLLAHHGAVDVVDAVDAVVGRGCACGVFLQQYSNYHSCFEDCHEFYLDYRDHGREGEVVL